MGAATAAPPFPACSRHRGPANGQAHFAPFLIGDDPTLSKIVVIIIQPNLPDKLLRHRFGCLCFPQRQALLCSSYFQFFGFIVNRTFPLTSFADCGQIPLGHQVYDPERSSWHAPWRGTYGHCDLSLEQGQERLHQTVPADDQGVASHSQRRQNRNGPEPH